jgi:hypothetical protein
MIIEVSDAAADAIVRALYTVASAGGRQPISTADRRGIEGAHRTVLGRGGEVDPDALAVISPDELAAAVTSDGARLDTLRMAAVMAIVDAVVDDVKLHTVLDIAEAFAIEPGFVRAFDALARNDLPAAATAMVHANVRSIPGLPWIPDDPFKAFLPYGEAPDPALEARYEALADKPAGTLGRTFFEHYQRNGFSLPGSPTAVGEAWGTPHDCLHVLSGYDTSPQGEILVSAFNGGALTTDDDPFESNVLPSAITYHMGIELNKGINVGDRERMAHDPSWRDNFEGNVHLGLDPAKLWVAWARGRETTVDVFSGRWVFWDHVDAPLDELRDEWRIPALDPADAATPDDQIDSDDFRRPGLPLPTKSDAALAERPTTT